MHVGIRNWTHVTFFINFFSPYKITLFLCLLSDDDDDTAAEQMADKSKEDAPKGPAPAKKDKKKKKGKGKDDDDEWYTGLFSK